MLEFTPLTADDLPFLIEVRNECRECLHDNRVFSLAECEQWFHSARPDFHIIRLQGERIGYFRLSHYDPERGSIYVGADIHKLHRGQGHATRAYEAFLPLVRDRYHVSRVELEVLSHNTAALGLYRKLGFVETSRKTGHAVRDGQVVDSIVMTKSL